MSAQTQIKNMEPIAAQRQLAAHLVGVSPAKFDQLVDKRLVPQPAVLDGIKLWIIKELEESLLALKSEDREEEESPW